MVNWSLDISVTFREHEWDVKPGLKHNPVAFVSSGAVPCSDYWHLSLLSGSGCTGWWSNSSVPEPEGPWKAWARERVPTAVSSL